MTTPHGLTEIVKVYGDIRAYIRPDGTLRPEWERHSLTTIDLPADIPLSWDPERKVRRMRCHVKVADSLNATLRSIHANDLWDDLENFGGCFEYRRKRKGSKLSLHAWGVAVDFDTVDNEQGEEPLMHSGIVQIFEANGWEWGGRWASPDGMHFQKASGY